MTTASWSTVIDQSTDAGFRTWGSELSTKFAAVGMVQTGDTGQINWTTVTRAAVNNTAAGYEIWRLSSSNLYFKIEYGSGSTQPVFPAMWITVGTGSNGSGTLTGQLSTRTILGSSNVGVTSTVTNYQSYLCATANYFGLAHKIGSQAIGNKPRHFIVVAQTVDATGAATSVGYVVIVNNTSNNVNYQAVATTAGVSGTIIATANCFLVPGVSGVPASSLDGAGNNQAWLFWFNLLGTSPMTPLLHLAAALVSDIAIGVTASMTLIGSTAHTYLSAGSSMTTDASGTITASTVAMLLLWE